MAEPITLLALFDDIEPASVGIEKLHAMGIADYDMNIISGVPFPGRVLGRPSAISHVSRIGLAGAVLGFLFGLFLIYGTPYLFPLVVGGQPVYPGPMGFIVTFEMTMLGLMGFSFLGMFVDSGFPTYTPKDYVPQISNGKIAVLFKCDQSDEKRYSDTLKKLGAESVEPAEARQL